MNRVAADQEQQTTGNGEPVRNRMNGASYSERMREDPDPIDAMQATADHLVRIATKAFMQMRSVDYETAQRWIAGAVERDTQNKKPAPKPDKPGD